VNEKKSTKKRGRPKLAKGEVKDRIVPVRLNNEELKLFTKAADASEHKTLSSWIPHSLREAATR
jgi:uncharacterized protein (DUF1778 family)